LSRSHVSPVRPVDGKSAPGGTASSVEAIEGAGDLGEISAAGPTTEEIS
jgi:hypothetical protein